MAKKDGKMYDVIIIGAGMAGLTAAIYCARYNLNTIIISKDVGGAIVYSNLVENYPGFKKISGYELMQKIKDQVLNLKVPIKESETVEEIKKIRDRFQVTSAKEKYLGKTIILAAGLKRKKLNLPNEEKYIGKGISYCAICDAPFFKNKIVAVVGGSDSAVVSALLLAEYAKKVIIIYRKDKLRAEPYRINQIKANKKIQVIYNANVKQVKGKELLEAVKLDNGKQLKINGLFIEAGYIPNTVFVKQLGIETDKKGYILVDKTQKTNVNGVYAAGDLTSASNSIKQLTCAASEATIAANSIFNKIGSEK